MSKTDHATENEKQKLIAQSISAAALLLIEWVREQIPVGEGNNTECQQSPIIDPPEKTKRKSR
jgi:hypothetical protein